MSVDISASEKGLTAEDLGIDTTSQSKPKSGLRPPPPIKPTIDWGNRVLEQASLLTPQRLADIATHWSHAFNKFTYSQEREDYADWDNQAMDQYQSFRALFSRRTRLLRKDEDRHKVEAQRRQNFATLTTIIADPDFTARPALTQLMQYDLWMDKPKKWFINGQGEEGEWVGHQREEYNEKKELYRPPLEAALATAATLHEQATIDGIFTGYANIGEQADATQVLFAPDMTTDQRTQAAVGYINAFGFISFIDLLAHKIRDPQISQEASAQYREMYKRLQGEEVASIMQDLSEVYKSVDFHHYALSTETLTRDEATRVEQTLGEIALEVGRDQHALSIVDLGAGTGRLTKELTKRGYDEVTAVEYESHHANKIRQEAPTARVIQGSWADLEDLLGEEKEVDLIFSYMRSLCHNRTPDEMFHVFDEGKRVLNLETGRMLFDMPSENWGEYRTRIQQLNIALQNLGIRGADESMIFDGPDEEHKFNRRILRPEQIDAMARMLGFKRDVKVSDRDMGGKPIDNLYYELQVDPDFNPRYISMSDLFRDAHTLGLYNPGADYSLFVKSWGMTLGQALTYGLGADEVRLRNLQGDPPKIDVTVVGDKLHFAGSL